MTPRKQPSDVFVCHTPLHVLITQKIIAKREIKKFCVVYISENRSPKNLYYYSLLEDHAEDGMFFTRRKSPIDFLRMLPRLLRLRQKAANGRIYGGNIKTFYTRFVFWVLGFSELCTFDDGIGNIMVENGVGYLTEATELTVSRVFFGVFDKSLLYKNIVKRIVTHFTIYTHPNIYKNTTYIDLLTDHVERKAGAPQLNVFLSSAFFVDGAMEMEFEQAFYDTIVRQYDVTLVIRHPRNELYVPPEGVVVSDSLKIAEHQIFDLAKIYDVLVIAPFYSTALVNLPAAIRKLNVVTFGIKGDRPELRVFYRTLGIETVDINVLM